MTPEQRRAIAIAKARKAKAEAESQSQAALPQPRQADAQGDPNLPTYRIPEKMFGLPMPYAGGETQLVGDAANGFQLEVPTRAPEVVQRGMVAGASTGNQVRQEQNRLAERGASILGKAPTGRLVAPLLTSPRYKQDGGRNKNLERIASGSLGLQDLGTLGFSDEFAGLIGGAEALNKQRADLSAAYKHHPIATMIGGLPALAIPGQGVRGVTTGAKALSGLMRGGAFGGTYGAGSGESAGERVLRGSAGAVTGGVLGGGFVLSGRGLDYGGRKILGSAEVRSLASKMFGQGSNTTTIKELEDAITQVQRAARINEEPIDRATAKARLIQAMQTAQENDMFGELIEGGLDGLEGSALPGNAAAETVTRRIIERGEGQYGRISKALGTIADGQDVKTVLANVAKTKEEEARPLYRQAFSQDALTGTQIAGHPRFKDLNNLVQLEDFQRGRAAGERIWRLRTKNPQGRFDQMSFTEQMDWIKKGLDAEIGKLLRAGDNETAGALIGAKNDMLSIVDDMNPVYGEARRIFAGAEEQEAAALLGEALFNQSGKVQTGGKFREIEKLYESFSESEQTAFAIGLFDRALAASGDVIESGTANSAKRGFLTPNSERALRQFLPDAQADDFINMIQREYRQGVNANKVLGGSPTGRRINAGQAVQDVTSGIRGAAAGLADPQGMVRQAQRAIQQRIGQNPRVQRQFGEFLSSDVQSSPLMRALGLADEAAPEPPAGSAGQYGIKDKALDASAVGITAGSLAAPTAKAEEMNPELIRAQEQTMSLEKQLAGIDADLALINDTNTDDRALQEVLQRRVNPDLAIDGVVGPETRAAINEMRGELNRNRDRAIAELESARKRETQVQQRDIYASKQRGPIEEMIMSQVPLAGLLLGAGIGMRNRGQVVNRSKVAAQNLEKRMNNLLSTDKIGSAKTGPKSATQRATNLNEFWRVGGSKEEPFHLGAKGQIKRNPNAAEVNQLFKKKRNPFTTSDVGWTAGGLAESAAATDYLSTSKQKLQEAQDRADAAEDSGNLAAYEKALDDIRREEQMVALWTFMQRAGLGYAGYRTLGAIKSPLASARPALGQAQNEQALLLQHIGKPKANAKPKKPKTNKPANDR